MDRYAVVHWPLSFVAALFLCVNTVLALELNDVVVSDVSYRLSGAKIYQNKEIRIYLEFSISNMATVEGCCAISSVTAPSANFAPQVHLTDADLSIPEVDTVELDPVPLEFSREETAALSYNLLDREQRSFTTAVATVIVPDSSCSDIQYLCLHISKGSGATFTEAGVTNNYHCFDISASMGCTEDTLNLGVHHFEVVEPLVHAGASLAVDFLVTVSLYGSRTLSPDTDSGSDVYAVKMFLSTDTSVNPAIDKELTDLPGSFEGLNQGLTSDGVIDISGPGIVIPPLSGDDQVFCGPVYLISYLDGPQYPGNIDEINEDDNVIASLINIQCSGDHLALIDFEYDLGPYQEMLFQRTTTPVWVTATVYNNREDGTPFYPGVANFELSLYLNNQPNLQGNALQVSQPTVTYFDEKDALTGGPVARAMPIKAKLWIDEDKFMTDQFGATHLILKVNLPEGWTGSDDTVDANDYKALPIAISQSNFLQQVNYRFTDADPFHIRQRISEGSRLLADGTMIPVSSVGATNTPLGDDKLSFEGVIDLDSGTFSSMKTKLHWSLDDKFDDGDVDSGVQLQIYSTSPYFILAPTAGQLALEPPEDKRYCGSVYGIVHFLRNTDENEDNENLKYDNFGMDKVLLQCDSSDTLGLTDLKVIDAPVIYADIPTPVTLEVTVSCTSSDCSGMSTAQVNFQLKIHLDDESATHSIVEPLAAITSNSDADAYTGDGLQSLLKRATFFSNTFLITKTVTIPAAQCSSTNRYIGVELLKADGSADDYTDNDYYTVELPEMICDTSVPMIDLSVDTFEVSGGVGTLPTGEPLGFDLDVALTLSNGRQLSASVWPHFDLAYYISEDNALSMDDIRLQSVLSPCQHTELVKEYTATETITLDSLSGITLPSQGLEKFCGASELYILVVIDSYETLDGKGQIFETLETNNVGSSRHTSISGLECENNINSEQLLTIEVVSVNLPDVVRDSADLTFNMVVEITNHFHENILGGTEENNDFSVLVHLAGDADTDDGDEQKLVVSVDEAEKLYMGMEAGGTLVLSVTGQLCANVGPNCVEDNVMTFSECGVLEGLEPQLLVSVGNLRAELVADYTTGPMQSIPVNLHCGATLTPQIRRIDLASEIHPGSHTYTLHYVVDVYNYNSVDGSFQDNQDNFGLSFVIHDEGSAQTVDVTLTAASLAHENFQVAITKDSYVTFEGSGTFALPGGQCGSWATVEGVKVVYLDVTVDNLFSALTDASYTGGSSLDMMLNSIASCETSYVDLGISTFTLLQTADGSTEDNAITVNEGKKFDLTVTVTQSNSLRFDENGVSDPRHFTVRFYISSDDVLDPEDWEVSQDTFADAVYDTPMKAASDASNPVDQELNWDIDGGSHLLVVDDYAAGHFCSYDDVFLIAHALIIDDTLQGKEPDDINDYKAVNITLTCSGDVYETTYVDNLPSELYVHDNSLLELNLTVKNTLPNNQNIPPGTGGLPNFGLELYYFDADLYSSDAMKRLQIPLSRLEMDNPEVLSAGIPAGSSITLQGVQMWANIDQAICTQINENGLYEVAVQPSTGLDSSLVDRVTGNNGFVVRGVTCTADSADLSIKTFEVQGAIATDIGIGLEVEGILDGTKSLTQDPYHFQVKYYLSKDTILDPNDYEIDYSFDGTDHPDNTATGTSTTFTYDFTDSIPLPANYDIHHCGRTHVIVVVDSNDEVAETDETNNIGVIQVTMKPCDKDIYDIENVDLQFQTWAYADRPFTVEFDASVYNVRAVAVTPASDNFALKLYAQIGTESMNEYLIDITPTWTFTTSGDDAKFGENHEPGIAMEFTGVRGDVLITEAMCSKGVDYLTLGVVAVEDSLAECVTYNNFYSIPLDCRQSDNVDVYVDRDRNGIPTFRLDTDDVIVLDQDKSFILDMAIDVDGSGWPDMTASPSPVFSYSMLLTDGTTTIPITVDPKKDIINAATSVPLVHDFSGVINLAGGTFLPLCKAGLDLIITVDTLEELEESNEGNNEIIISGIEVSDGGSLMCSDEIDLTVTDFDVLPLNKELIISLPNPDEQMFDFTFTFAINKGPTSTASDPASFKYKLVMSAVPDHTDASLTQVRQTEKTVTDMGTTTITDSASIQAEFAEDQAVQRFCGKQAYLGVMIDSGAEVDEADDDDGNLNNYMWTMIILRCPALEAISLEIFDVTATDKPSNTISDSGATEITFHLGVLNKGVEIPANGGGDNMAFKLHVNSDASLDGATEITGVTYGEMDDPALDGVIQSMALVDYNAATASFTLPNGACLDTTHLCFEVEPANGVNDLFRDDNFICIDLVAGPVTIDCARDLTTTLGSLDPVSPQIEIYQDTLTPLDFSIQLGFTGRTLAADGSGVGFIGFEFYLSDQDDITPTTINSAAELLVSSSIQFDYQSELKLSVDLSDGQSLTLAGRTMVEIGGEMCANEDRFLCARYALVKELQPALRDSDTSNDFSCVDVASILGCHENTTDLSPVWMDFGDGNVVVDEGKIFDLQVWVEKRSSAEIIMVEPLKFESTLTLSEDEVLGDEGDEELGYAGFGYGTPGLEMQRPLGVGEFVLNMGGVPLIIPDSVNRDKCGRTHVIYSADTGSPPVIERYETNNIYVTPIVLHCPGDQFAVYDLDVDIPDPIVPGFDARFTIDITVHNVGQDLPMPTPSNPNYLLKVYLCDSPTLGNGGTEVDVTSPAGFVFDDRTRMIRDMAQSKGKTHELYGVQVTTDGSLFTMADCPAITHLLICATPGPSLTDGVSQTDCKAISLSSPDQIRCMDGQTKRNIRALDFTIPDSFAAPGSIDVTQILEVKVGSGSLPFLGGEFISALYLSKHRMPNPDEDLRILQLSNGAIEQDVDTKYQHTVVSISKSISALSDELFCGKVFVHLVVDADDDLDESSNLDNHVTKEAVVLCDSDYLSISNPQLEIMDGSLVEGIEMMFDLWVDVTCAKEVCDVGVADDNIKITIDGAETPDSASTQLVEITSSWQQEGRIITPSLGSSFVTPFETRRFHVFGPLDVPVDHCGDVPDHVLLIRVDFGASLSGASDGVTDNNVIVYPYRCKPQANRDLIATSLTFLAGESLNADRPAMFTLGIDLVGEAIPPTDTTLPASPFTFSVYLSEDPVLSEDDKRIMYHMTGNPAGELNKGIDADSSLSLLEFTEGIRFPEGSNGWKYIIVFIDDKDRIEESSEANNVIATRIYIESRSDVYEVMPGEVKIPDHTFQDVATTVTFSLSVKNIQDFDVVPTSDIPPLTPFVALSDDDTWDHVNDLLITDITIPEGPAKALSAGILSGQTLSYEDISAVINLPAATCSPYHYIIFGIMGNSDQPLVETYLKNNWVIYPFEVVCSDARDIEVTTFTLPGALIPDEVRDYTLTVSVTVPADDEIRPFTYSLWLSTDTNLDKERDVLLNMNIDPVLPIHSPISSTTPALDLSGTGDRGARIPADIPEFLCGNVYMIVVMDSTNANMESNEDNNIAKAEAVLECPLNMFSVRNLVVTPSVTSIAPNIDNQLTIQLEVACLRTDGSCPAAPADSSQVHFTFDLKVYDENGYIIGDMSPSTINAAWVTAESGLDPADGLKKDYSGATKVYDLTITGGFQLGSADVCSKVRYIGVQIIKGDSAEMSAEEVGPESSTHRMVPYHFKCLEVQADIWINSFSINGGPSVDLAPGSGGVLDFSLDVRTSATNIPKNDMEFPIFQYRIYASDDDSLSDDDVDIGYIPPSVITDTLRVDFTTQAGIDLSDGSGAIDVGKVRHLCGAEGAHLIAIMDPYNLVEESVETNNVGVAPVTFENCLDGFDLQLSSFPAPSVVQSGDEIPVNVEVDIMIVGPLALPLDLAPESDPKEKYFLSFRLIDDLENPNHDIPYDTSSLFGTLSQSVQADSLEETQSGIVTIITQTLSGSPLKIPTDYVACEQSWYLEAKVDINEVYYDIGDLSPHDNGLRQYISIECPVDSLALYSYNVLYVPEAWRSESINHIDLYISAINYGDDILKGDAQYIYAIKQYFSIDDVLDEADVEQDVKMYTSHGDYYYDFRQSKMETGQIVVSPRVSGLLSLPTMDLCEEAKLTSSKPTLFWKLIPGDEANSPFVGNDVFMYPLDKSIFHCIAENVDLSASQLTLQDGNITIIAGVPKPYVLTIHQTKTASGSITPITDINSEELSYRYDFYLSNDDKWDEFDAKLEITFTDSQKETLQGGVLPETDSDIDLAGDNLIVDVESNPELGFYCGMTYIIAVVTDLQNLQSTDPVLDNNYLSKQIQLECSGDLIAFQSLAIEIIAPQQFMFPYFSAEFNFLAELKNFGSDDIPDSVDRPLVIFRAYLSPDSRFDPMTDPEIEVEFPDEIQLATHKGIQAGTTKVYSGIVKATADLSVCTYQPKYLIIYAHKGASLNMNEEILGNNYQYIPIDDTLNCTLSTMDAEVTSFSLATVDLAPGDDVSFTLEVTVSLNGSSTIGPTQGRPDLAIEYDFYLSTSERLDETALPLGYSMIDHMNLLDNLYLTSTLFTLDSATENIVIPPDVDARFCGSVYLVAFADPNARYLETHELNNMLAIPVNIVCQDDMFAFVDVTYIQMQEMYYQGPGIIRFSFTVKNMFEDEIPAHATMPSIVLKMYIMDESQEGFMHDITPVEWNNFLGFPFMMTDAFQVGDEQTHMFINGKIDVASACRADVSPIDSGTHKLVLVILKGSNPALHLQFDAIIENNQHVSEINVDCTTNYFDLKYDVDVSPFELQSGDTLSLGPNPFNLMINVEQSGNSGWELTPSDPDSPAQFTYTLKIKAQMQQIIDIPDPDPDIAVDKEITRNIDYDYQSTKSVINAETRDGQAIDLSDNGNGLDLPPSDYLFLCLAQDTMVSPMITAAIDDGYQVSETDEDNNFATLIVQKPGPVDCPAGKDFSIWSWGITSESVTYDIVQVDTTYDYDFQIQLVLVDEVLDGLGGTGFKHFAVTFFLSLDETYDPLDTDITVTLSADQESQLERHASNFDIMDMSDANLAIPLTLENYPYCWKRVYLGVMVDSDEEVSEVNEDNNAGFYNIILDCGDEVNECDLGFDDCSEAAVCVDEVYHLYSETGAGFSCQCAEGYRGDGIVCENIDECTELAGDGSPLHNCETIVDSVCNDIEGSFECICAPGYEIGGSNACEDIDECMDPNTLLCHENADCENTVGSFNCECSVGFSGDGMTNCTNIDDCLPDSCSGHGECVDDIASVVCLCEEFHSGDFCEIADGNWGSWEGWSSCMSECGDGIQTRDRLCDNPAPTSDGRICVTVNGTGAVEERECNNGECQGFDWCSTDPCNEAQGGRCSMVDGGATFTCSCTQGYKMVTENDLFVRCDDINECVELDGSGNKLHACDILATCLNEVGTYSCFCMDGYVGDGMTCQDRNECDLNEDDCDVNADCVNVGGGYNCECLEGFKQEKLGDPKTGTCIVERLFPTDGHTKITTKSVVTGERLSNLITVPHGLPVAGGQLMNSLYITENGAIVGTENTIDDLKQKTFRIPQRLAKEDFTTLTDMDKLLIATFWSDTDSEEEISEVTYKVYTDTTVDNPIFSKVAIAIDEMAGEVIEPQFLLIVTWTKMKPGYSAEPGELSTFQAIVTTDYTKSFAYYLFDNGQMTWNPIYTADEVQLVYDGGYPARIGYVVIKPDGSSVGKETLNSGKWSTDSALLNAYRADRDLMQADHIRLGEAVFRLDDNGVLFTNPRKACSDWHQAEGDVNPWGAYLVGNCPQMKDQIDLDIRYSPEAAPTVDGNLCYNFLYNTANGGNIRCCYDDASKSLISPSESNNGIALTSRDQAGFVSRYPKSTSASSNHMLKDVLPFQWCCLDSKQYGDQYCNMYVERRPLSSSENYDVLGAALVHGALHFTSVDGLDFSYSGFGEFILLKSVSGADVPVMIQGRTNTVPVANILYEPRATYLSAIAMQVGGDHTNTIQIYLNAINNVDVYVDDTLLGGPSDQSLNYKIMKTTSPVGAVVQFKEGIFVEVSVRQVGIYTHLRAVVHVPSYLQSNGFEGILGNVNGDPSDDLVPHGGLGYNPDTATPDNIYAFGNSWSLRMVYGQSPTGTSANTKTLFNRYVEYTDNEYDTAVSYYKLGYSPLFYTLDDFTVQEQQDCTMANFECLYDYRLSEDINIGIDTLNSRKDFTDVTGELMNAAPQFREEQNNPIHAQVHTPLSLSVTASDSAGEVLMITASIKNSAGEEQLGSPDLGATGDSASGRAVYTSTLDWTPTIRDSYTVELTVTDSKDVVTNIKPLLILCDCLNEGTCDYDTPVNQTGTFAYATCSCPPSWSGQFCHVDYDGCFTSPCFTYCTDRTAQQVDASADQKQFECSPCADNMDGNGETCTDLNECLLPSNDTRRHTCDQGCTNTAGGYICSCNSGFNLAEDLHTCADIPECISAAQNDCDLENGYCLDDVEGSFTCYCKEGFVEAQGVSGHKCIDKNECLDFNGGCDRQCVNTVGSFHCECGQGYEPHDTIPDICQEVNECDIEPKCDQTCIDRVGYYECSCSSGFVLDDDGFRCRPLTECVHKVCDDLAYCGVDLKNIETCHCPHGYTLDPIGQIRCDDVDECAMNIHHCNEHAICNNIAGGYECVCSSGFVLNGGDNRRCNDIDECSGDNHGCDQVCVNMIGSFECQCSKGYIRAEDGKSCIDIDECAPGQPNECSNEAICQNLPGSYSCQCKPGFTGTGFTCTDVNECLEDNAGCDSACENTYGGFKCTCVRGYITDPEDPTKCKDVDECGTPLDMCTHRCINTRGSFQCQCDQGFRLVGGTTCEPIDACEEQCGGGTCIRLDGVKTCHCNVGYRKNAGALDECVNINECTIDTSQAEKCEETEHAYCIDTEGSYKCVCTAGYRLNNDNITCSDLDECNTPNPDLKHTCDTSSSYCSNLNGTYECLCKEGYRQVDSAICADINECEDKRVHQCHRRADCVNLPGKYECRCKDGYVGNGFICEDKNECLRPEDNTCAEGELCVDKVDGNDCMCKDGYKRNIYDECVDIDECASPLLNDCEYAPGCINMPGSYRCTCYQDGILQNDGKTCKALNPCDDASACSQTCRKVFGVDTCLCSYPLDPTCNDLNECTQKDIYGLTKSPCNLEHSTCVNKDPFFQCQCDEPWLPDTDGLGCSETNGRFSEWTEWTDCSRKCYGRRTRQRECNNPRPVGINRDCVGESMEYEMCNDNEAICGVKDKEIETGAMITFYSLPPERWEDVEAAVFQAISDQVNVYCRLTSGTYEKCCKTPPSSSGIPERDFITSSDVVAGKAYPHTHGMAGSRVVVAVTYDENNAFCLGSSPANDEGTPNQNNQENVVSGARRRRDTEDVRSRVRRATDENSNRTAYEFLDQETLMVILNLPDFAQDVISELLWADLDDLIKTVNNRTIEPAFYEDPITTAAPPPPAPKPKGLPLWAIIVIVLVCLLVLIVAIVIVAIVCKRKQHQEKVQVSPHASTASLKRHDALAEEKTKPTDYVSASKRDLNDTENPAYVEGDDEKKDRPRTPASVNVEADGEKRPLSAVSKQSRVSPHQEETNLPGTPLPNVESAEKPPAEEPQKGKQKPKKAAPKKPKKKSTSK